MSGHESRGSWFVKSRESSRIAEVAGRRRRESEESSGVVVRAGHRKSKAPSSKSTVAGHGVVVVVGGRAELEFRSTNLDSEENQHVPRECTRKR